MNLNGQSIPVRDGDSVLIAILRAGRWPETGGCLCLAGDCPHCLARIDGVAYRRMCQVPAQGVESVVPHGPRHVLPLLESLGPSRALRPRHLHCDVAVIGQGPAGREAASAARASGLEVVALDAHEGAEVVGIYPGPLVVAKTATEILQVRPTLELVIATGAVELHAVADGNDLRGLLTRRAAMELHRRGIALGRVAAVGQTPDGVNAIAVKGVIVRFEPRFDDARRLGAIVVRTDGGDEQRVACDTVSVDLGLTPRDALVRLAAGTAVRAIGDVARLAALPAPPASGAVCPCLGVRVSDLESVFGRGFTELELMKRASLAGTGPCQGAICLPHLRSFLAAHGTPLQPAFTARPVTRPITLGEAATGAFHQATPRTALDGEHRRHGARMERLGGWWRPWTYGDGEAEYRAVRQAVSICDVSTLAKIRVSGPDAVRLLEHLYPLRVAAMVPGRSRYAILLNERGYVIDDGMICRDAETRYTLTFTTGGATQAELWIRDWAETIGADVRILNQTWSRGAINVTGPRATELLTRLGARTLPAFLEHRALVVARIDCHGYRLSFTGEVSYELHHDAVDSVRLWRALLDGGRRLGVAPHGLETLMRLRLEKGHVVVGQDTDFDSTPRRLGLGGIVRLEKPDFVGRRAVQRTNAVPLDRRLVGLEMTDRPPREGALIWSNGIYAGYVTSAAWSPTLKRAVMLGWVREVDGRSAGPLMIDGRPARVVPTPFYDPEGSRARA